MKPDARKEPALVWLAHWRHPVYGDRWTLNHEDRAVRTFDTEDEAQEFARQSGWRVEGVHHDP